MWKWVRIVIKSSVFLAMAATQTRTLLVWVTSLTSLRSFNLFPIYESLFCGDMIIWWRIFYRKCFTKLDDVLKSQCLLLKTLVTNDVSIMPEHILNIGRDTSMLDVLQSRTFCKITIFGTFFLFDSFLSVHLSIWGLICCGNVELS